jgi:hypothetical protein
VAPTSEVRDIVGHHGRGPTFIRFRKAGEWRLKVYLVESTRRAGKVMQETVAYLGSIDSRHLGAPPDDQRERASIRARVRFWEAANPKLRTLVNRVGGDDAVKRVRMAVHARIPWPMQPERDRLGALDADAEAALWHRLYQSTQRRIEANDRVIESATKKREELRKEAMTEIGQANKWKAEAEARRPPPP